MAVPPANLVRLPEPPEPTARDRLAATWLPVVAGWCRRLGGPRIDADDATHDAMLVLLERHRELRDPAAIRAFVFGITRRTLAAHRRRAWVRRWVGGDPPEVPSERRGPHGDAEGRELAARVAEALEALSTDHREVIVLVEIEGWTLEESSELLGVPLGTVKSRLTRARGAFEVAARRSGLQPDGEVAS